MRIEGKRNLTSEKIPDWEVELWSYLHYGDGTSCPASVKCKAPRLYGECPSKHKSHIKALIDQKGIDLHHFDFISNSSKYRISCRIFQLLEKLAKKYIDKGGISGPPLPSDLIELFDTRRQIDIREVQTRYLYSAIWYEGDSWVIQIKENDPEALKRHSLFHEGFHILSHCKTAPVFKKIGTEEGSFNELLAGYFGGCILVPKDWLAEKWFQIMNLEGMANLFKVTKLSMYIRLRQFGFIQ